MQEHRVVVVDFDGVIATYDKWRGEDVFGTVMPYASEALHEFKAWGWLVVVFTTRRDTPALRAWMSNAHIPFDAVNSIAHNPPNTSTKPIAEVYIDDRGWYDVRRTFSWVRVMRRMRLLYLPRVDAAHAAAWSSWWKRAVAWWDSEDMGDMCP